MMKAIGILLISCALFSSQAYAYSKKNKVYSLDIHKLISHIYSAQLASTPPAKVDHMNEAKKIFDRVSIKLPTATRNVLLKTFESYQPTLPHESYSKLVNELSIAFELIRAPSTNPNYADGKLKYEKFCTSCHGKSGDGDGPISAKFKGSKLALSSSYLSPFRCFNQNIASNASAGKSGISSATTEPGLWNICFYIFTLKQASNPSNQALTVPAKITLESLATGTHSNYEEWSNEFSKPMSQLRLWPYSPLIQRK